MASLWQKKSGTWCVTYRESGNQRVRSLRTKDRREALKLKRAIETKLEERGTFSLIVSDKPAEVHKNPPLPEFWSEFRSWATMHRSRRAVEEYTVWFKQFVDFANVDRMADVTPAHIEGFKAAIAKQGKRKAAGVGLSPTSINNSIRTLQSIWNHGIKLGLYTGENPFSQVERLRLPKTLDRDYLDKDRIDALLKAAKEHSDDKFVKSIEAENVYLAIALSALAGLRKKEVCFARWEWIDWKQRIIVVTNDEHFTTKNKRPRIISMCTQLIEILKPFQKAEGYILDPVRGCGHKTHYRLDFRKSFETVCRKAGIEATPHDLRHSFASRHAVAGTSLHVIAGWLGHSTTWITQRYAHFQKTFNAAADNI
jgi:integrase/recombinase XerC